MKRDDFTMPLGFADELIIDNFAGGGGTSTGLEAAFGRPVDIAINHNAEALRMHAANHPRTLHLCESVFDVDPIKVTRNQPVGLVWLSPDCKHFSKAKGGKPVDKNIRGLAWIALRWVVRTKPRAFMLENVEEFRFWGPLLLDELGNARPDPARKGETFDAFRLMLSTGIPLERREFYAEAIAEMRSVLCEGPLALTDAEVAQLLNGMRYDLDWSDLRACDYGTPTIRKRFFMVGRRDGLPVITRPLVTNGAPGSRDVLAGRMLPYRTAAECIDWSIPCPSIFERSRPLADATLRRIAKGIMRYVVDAAAPFIVRIGHTGHGDSGKVCQASDPLTTVTSKAEHLAIVPTLIQTGYGEREGQAPRALDLHAPLGTVVGGGVKHAMVSAFLAQHNKERTGVKAGRMVDAPISTITGSGSQQTVVTAALVGVGARAGQSRPRGMEEPIATVTAKYDTALVAAHLVHLGHGEQSANGAKRWSHGVRDVEVPLNTITASGAAAGLVTSSLVKLRGTSQDGQPVDEPLHTVSAQGQHFAEVRAFLIKYYGSDQAPEMGEPLHTITTKDRFGLVTIHGEEYRIVDIGLRMLTPRELFLAQGFPASYVIGDDPAQGLSLTKSAQVRMCGNSVCPPLAEALARANFAHEAKIAGRIAA